jgi:hypothetical protein
LQSRHVLAHPAYLPPREVRLLTCQADAKQGCVAAGAADADVTLKMVGLVEAGVYPTMMATARRFSLP